MKEPYASRHFESCGTPAHRLEIIEASMSYDSPSRGQPLNVWRMFFNPSEQINQGYILNTLTIHGEITYSMNVSLCDQTVCPIERGDNDYSSWGIWPEYIKGNFTVTQEWFATPTDPLLCITKNFQVGTDGYLNLDGWPYANYTEFNAWEISQIFLPQFPVIITHLQLITDPFITNPYTPPTPSSTPLNTILTAVQSIQEQPEQPQQSQQISLTESAGIGLGVSASFLCCLVWLYATLRRNWKLQPKTKPKKNKDTFVHVNPIYAQEWK